MCFTEDTDRDILIWVPDAHERRVASAPLFYIVHTHPLTTSQIHVRSIYLLVLYLFLLCSLFYLLHAV